MAAVQNDAEGTGNEPVPEVSEAARQLGEQMGFDPTEKLLPELAEYLCTTSFGPAIRHPLVYEVPYMEALAGMANQRYRAKVEALAEAHEARKWNTVIYLHERPWRLDAFLGIADQLSDDEYWNLLGDIWTDTENLWQNYDEWHEALMAERGAREQIMAPEERAFLDAQPDEFTIYRGYHTEGDSGPLRGYSWTLSREKAEWFGKRRAADMTPMLATATIRRDDVIAYFNERGEDEIVVLPEHLRDIRSETLNA